ncbi:MAG: zinc-binding alcohol dehydrogenase family protein [Planctomycetota bacterium]
MQTIVLEEPGRLSVRHTPAPNAPAAGEALVRVRRVGVCGTDIHAYGGRQPFFTYPRILGHELGVEVVAVGADVDHVQPGDRCAVEPYIHCGRCAACRVGKTNCCANLVCLGVHGDGGMREQIVVPAAKLHPSDRLSCDQLALVETLGIGKHAVDRAGCQPGQTVAIVGLGPIGLTAVQFALLAGARVVAIDTSPARCAKAVGLYPGIQTLQVHPERGTVEQWLALHDELPPIVFNATGHRGSMQESFGLTGHGGTLVFIGLVTGQIAFDDPDFHRKELTLMSSRNATAADFCEIIEAMESGRIDIRPWITHRAAAADWPSVFDGWLEPSADLLKGVVCFDDANA